MQNINGTYSLCFDQIRMSPREGLMPSQLHDWPLNFAVKNGNLDLLSASTYNSKETHTQI
jgi:hypothetical protein